MVKLRTGAVYGSWWNLRVLVLRSEAAHRYIRLDAATGSRVAVSSLCCSRSSKQSNEKLFDFRSKEEVITAPVSLGSCRDQAQLGKAMLSTPNNIANQGITYGWDQGRFSRLVKSMCFVLFPHQSRWNNFTVKHLPGLNEWISNAVMNNSNRSKSVF